MNPKLSVVIPFYNAASTLPRCLLSVTKALNHDMEIVLVDDASTDNSGWLAEKYGFRLLRLPMHQGAAAARNIGAQAARGELLLFLDSDVLVKPETFERLLETLEKRPEVASVSAVYSDQAVAPGWFQEFKVLEETIKYAAYTSDRYNSFDPHCAVIRREVFLKLGGFHEGYRGADIEDAEFGYRLTNHAINMIEKTVKVDHIYASFRQGLWNYFRRSFLWARLFLKRFKFDQAVTTSRNALSAILAFLAFVSGLFSWSGSLLFMSLFFIWNWPFIWLSIQKRAKFLKIVCFMFYLYCLHLSVGLGSAFGWLYWPIRNLGTREKAPVLEKLSSKESQQIQPTHLN